MKKLKLMSNNILFKFEDIVKKDERKTESGLHIPDTAKSMDEMVVVPTHTVLEVGPTVKDVKKGDIIVLHPNAQGISLVLSSEDKYVMFKEHEILAIIED